MQLITIITNSMTYKQNTLFMEKPSNTIVIDTKDLLGFSHIL